MAPPADRRSLFGAHALTLLGLIAALLLGAAGLRGMFQAERLARDFAERIHPDAMALVALRAALDELRRVGHPMPAESNRAAWSQLVNQARANVPGPAESRPAAQATLADQTDAALARLADTTGPGSTHQRLDAAQSALQALTAALRTEAEANGAARQQGARAGYTLSAAALLVATALVGSLALRQHADAAQRRAAQAPAIQAGPPDRKPQPDDIPTLHPEVVAPGYCGIERRGPDRPQNIVRGAFSGKAAPAAQRAGQEGAGEPS